MSDVIQIDLVSPIIEINPPAPTTIEVNPQQTIVQIEVTAPGGFSGGLGVEPLSFSRSVLTVSTGGIPVRFDGNYRLESYTVEVRTAPTGAAVILDINKNDVTIFTTQANRPTIAAGTTSGTNTLPDIVDYSAGDKITIDIDQIGSTVAGANLSVFLRFRRLN